MGLCLNTQGLKACASMYRACVLFEMNAVQLEDVYVGLATEAWGLELQSCYEGRLGVTAVSIWWRKPRCGSSP